MNAVNREMNVSYDAKKYWDCRGGGAYKYRGETFYTITPVPYYYRRRFLLLDIMRPLVAEGRVVSICDFGCGDGWYLKYFSDRYGGKRYYGVDMSDVMVKLAQGICPLATIESSNEGISFKKQFDLIYSIAVFAHVRDVDIPVLFRNIYSHLNVGGRFILFEQTGFVRKEGNTWCRRMTSEYLEKAKKCGFKVESRSLISFPAHRRLGENFLFPYMKRFLCLGRSLSNRELTANRSTIFRLTSEMLCKITREPLVSDDGSQDGNTIYIFKKS